MTEEEQLKKNIRIAELNLAAAEKKLDDYRQKNKDAVCEKLDEQYAGKYFLMYGKDRFRLPSIKDPLHKIFVHIMKINFQGRGFIRANAKVIEMETFPEDPAASLGKKSEDVLNLSYYETSNFDFKPEDLEKEMTVDEIGEIVGEAKTAFNTVQQDFYTDKWQYENE